jgi:hypothetical protein
MIRPSLDGFSALRTVVCQSFLTVVIMESSPQDKSDTCLSLQDQLSLLKERVLTQQRQLTILQSEFRSWRSIFIGILVAFLCISIAFQISLRPHCDCSSIFNCLETKSLEGNFSRLSTEISRINSSLNEVTRSLSKSKENPPQVPVKPPKMTTEPKSRLQNSIECPFKGLFYPLHGIIRYLTQSALGNVHERGFVEITGGGEDSC